MRLSFEKMSLTYAVVVLGAQIFNILFLEGLCSPSRQPRAVIQTHDLTKQITYACPGESELSCIVLWKIVSRSGFLGTNENFYRLQCGEVAPVIECKLPHTFSANYTRLIKPKQYVDPIILGDFRRSGNFVKLGCTPTSSSICNILHGEAYKSEDEIQYVFKVRCKEVLERDCQSSPIEFGDKLTALIKYDQLDSPTGQTEENLHFS